jgi:hypothetical protein
MINRPLPDKPLFTAQEAATKLNMSIKTLMSHIHAGRLRFINIGSGGVRKRYRFTTYNLQTFIEDQKVREVLKCQSTSVPTLKPIVMTSNSGAVDFLAIPRPEAKKTPAPLSAS